MKRHYQLAVVLLIFAFFLTACIAFPFYLCQSRKLFPAALCLGFIVMGLLYSGIAWGRFIKTRRKSRQNLAHKLQAQFAKNLEDSKNAESDLILYLRPFDTDRKKITGTEYSGATFHNIESVICQMFQDTATPVAVKNPKTETQSQGAVKISLPTNQWQPHVLEYLEAAKYIVLYVDFSPGVQWEINAALSAYKDKLILIPTMYNTRENFSYAATTVLFPGLAYPLHALRFYRFGIFKKRRRKRKYYRLWDATFHFPFEMNDTVSAVIFQDGNAIPFYAGKPNLEAQFCAILQAVNTKCGIPLPSVLSVAENETPVFTLCADLDTSGIFGNILPFAMGRVEFYEKGFRYRNPLLDFFHGFNSLFLPFYKKHRRFRKNQLRPYSSIKETGSPAEGRLTIIFGEANGSSQLVVPRCHACCIPKLQAFLTHCRETGTICRSLADELTEIQNRQESGYYSALLLLETVSLISATPLLLLSLIRFTVLCPPFFHIAALWHFTVCFFYLLFYGRINHRFPFTARRPTSATAGTKGFAILFPLLHLLLSLSAVFLYLIC